MFRERRDAGRVLAGRLAGLAEAPSLIVLGLPRGGVPVVAEVAAALGAPLDVLLVRKLGVPHHEELAMGAIASGGAQVMNANIVRELRIPEDVIRAAVLREQTVLAARERLFRGDRPEPDLRDRTVVIVDDGLATGATMLSAVQTTRSRAPRSIVVAVPVGSAETCRELQNIADEVVCLESPEPFSAVGLSYMDFSPTTDAEVVAILGGGGASV